MDKRLQSSLGAASAASKQFGISAEELNTVIDAIGLVGIMSDGAARERIWKQKYPDSIEKIEQIFGSLNPSIKEIIDWKRTWHSNDIQIFTSTPKLATKRRLDTIPIHPLFWDYQVRTRINHDGESLGSHTAVVFYDEETHFLVKLHYGNDL